jgi:hypothetical protein
VAAGRSIGLVVRSDWSFDQTGRSIRLVVRSGWSFDLLGPIWSAARLRPRIAP